MHIEIFIIYYRVLGTPTEEIWQGITQLPDYKSSFPKWSAKPLSKTLPTLEEDGVDLLQVKLFTFICNH